MMTAVFRLDLDCQPDILLMTEYSSGCKPYDHMWRVTHIVNQSAGVICTSYSTETQNKQNNGALRSTVWCDAWLKQPIRQNPFTVDEKTITAHKMTAESRVLLFSEKRYLTSQVVKHALLLCSARISWGARRMFRFQHGGLYCCDGRGLGVGVLTQSDQYKSRR